MILSVQLRHREAKPRRSSTATCVVVITVCVTTFLMANPCEANCSQADTKLMAHMFQPRASFTYVISELDTMRADYMIFSNDQRISMDTVRFKGYKALRTIYVLLKSQTRSSSHKLVTSDEILTLERNPSGSNREGDSHRG